MRGWVRAPAVAERVPAEPSRLDPRLRGDDVRRRGQAGTRPPTPQTEKARPRPRHGAGLSRCSGGVAYCPRTLAVASAIWFCIGRVTSPTSFIIDSVVRLVSAIARSNSLLA